MFVSRPFVNFAGTAGQVWFRPVSRRPGPPHHERRARLSQSGGRSGWRDAHRARSGVGDRDVRSLPLDGSSPQRMSDGAVRSASRHRPVAGPVAHRDDGDQRPVTDPSRLERRAHQDAAHQGRHQYLSSGLPRRHDSGDGLDARRSDWGVADERRRQRSAPAGAHPRSRVAVVHGRRQPGDLLVVCEHRALHLECADRRRPGG